MNNKNEKKEKPLIGWPTIIICAILFVVCIIGAAIGPSGGCGKYSGGDGKESCKNCGRSPVVAYGYCEKCAESFMDWHNEYYD